MQGKPHEVFTNASDSMVSAALGGGGYGSPSVTINFHNWDVHTRLAGAHVACHDGYAYVNSADIPCCLGLYKELTRLKENGGDVTVQVRRSGAWEARTGQGRGDFGDEVLLTPYSTSDEADVIEFTFEGRGFEVIGRKSPGLGGLNATVTVKGLPGGAVQTDYPAAATTAAWPRTQEVLLSYSYDWNQVYKYTVVLRGPWEAAGPAVDAIRIKP